MAFVVIEEKELAKIKLNANTYLVVTEQKTKDNKVYYDVRKSYKDEGELVKTRKGIMLTADQWKIVVPILGGVIDEQEVSSGVCE